MAAMNDVNGDDYEVRTIGLDEIVELPGARKTHGFEPESIAVLAQSIRGHGLLHLPVVTPIGDGKYRLVSGRRRTAAARWLGWKEIRARVITGVDCELLDLVENLQREDLSARDKGVAICGLIEAGKCSQARLAAEVGKDKSYICRMVKLGRLIGDLGENVAFTQLSEVVYLELTAAPELLPQAEAEHWGLEKAREKIAEYRRRPAVETARDLGNIPATPSDESAARVHADTPRGPIRFLANDAGFVIERFVYRRGKPVDFPAVLEKLQDLMNGIEHAISLVRKDELQYAEKEKSKGMSEESEVGT